MNDKLHHNFGFECVKKRCTDVLFLHFHLCELSQKILKESRDRSHEKKNHHFLHVLH